MTGLDDPKKASTDFSVVAKDWFKEALTGKKDGEQGAPRFRARTALGRRLWELRQKHIASGARLLTWDEIEEEKRRRRGELEWENG